MNHFTFMYLSWGFTLQRSFRKIRTENMSSPQEQKPSHVWNDRSRCRCRGKLDTRRLTWSDARPETFGRQLMSLYPLSIRSHGLTATSWNATNNVYNPFKNDSSQNRTGNKVKYICMYGWCALCVYECHCMVGLECKNCQGLFRLKKIYKIMTLTETQSFTKTNKETEFLLTNVRVLQSLFEGLVDWGVGVQGGGTIVHELGGVVRSYGAEVASVRGVGQAGHHRHHFCYLLLQLHDLLLPLVDLAWIGRPMKQR